MCTISDSHFECDSHGSTLAECVMIKYTVKSTILAASKLRSLVSRGGKKVVILLQKLELELVISDCNVILQQKEMIKLEQDVWRFLVEERYVIRFLVTTVRSKMKFVEEDCSAKEATVC